MSTEWFERVRRTDPVTSKIAAKVFTEKNPQHEVRIIYALKKHGPLIAHEIADAVGLHYTQVCRRLPEMERDGHIEQTGVVRETPAGGKAREWRIRESS